MIVQADVQSIPLPDNSVDLVFTSPPYENARRYDIGFNLTGMDWVRWAANGFCECLRVCRGLVAWVVEGRTEDFSWSSTPVLLMAELYDRGIMLRKPPIFHRVGIPGSGGPDWLRNDYEFIVCAGPQGRLAWSENTAMGHAPKYAPGGRPSHRKQDGSRVNGNYKPPAKANPGNVIRCKVGKGHMGNLLAHKNEAPFPESLAEFFIRSFCPPGGIVLDPMAGSGTTKAVAEQCERRGIAMDIRESQCALTRERCAS